MFKIAEHRLDSKTESTEIGQSENTINVPNCISAIELRHLCKNEDFIVPEEVDIPLGFGIFWEIIVSLSVALQKACPAAYSRPVAASIAELTSDPADILYDSPFSLCMFNKPELNISNPSKSPKTRCIFALGMGSYEEQNDDTSAS